MYGNAVEGRERDLRGSEWTNWNLKVDLNVPLVQTEGKWGRPLPPGMIGAGNEGYELIPATRVLQGSPQCGPFALRSMRMLVFRV